MHTEPTRSTREFLRAQAGTNAKLRKYLKGVSAKQRREAQARAATVPLTDKQRGRE